ncbi:MAG: glycosyltransferase family 39 protein [Chloroflexi bacterium]|nr:glycosyltransferase family 39 protein [Chloroflexota bacterium]
MRAPPYPASARPRTAALYVALAAGTFMLAFALRYPSLYEPRWYGDEGIFAAIAQNMREGRTLYAQAWDNKPPLIFFTYAGIQSLFGTSVFALHLVTTAAVLGTQAAVMMIGALMYGGRRAIVAGALFAFAMGTPVIEGNLAMTETFMILPASLAVLVFVIAERRGDAPLAYYVAAGLLIGIAAGYKQVAVFDGAAIALMIWLTHARPLRALVPMAAGFAAPQAAFAAFFLANGAFGQYWYAVAGSLQLYSEAGSQGPFVRVAGYLPALLALAWLALRRQSGEEITLRSFPVLWLGFALAGSTSSSFPFPHYLQQAAPACALVIVANPFEMERERLARALLGVAAVLVVAAVFGQFALAFRERRQLNPVGYYRTFASYRWGTMSDLDYDDYFDGRTIAARDAVAFMRSDGAGTSLYTWSELPWVYAAGGFTNPARYYTSFLGEILPDAKRDILRDLAADPPVYILVSDGAYAPFGELDNFMRGRYALLHEQGDWRLYRLSTANGKIDPDPQVNARR